MIDEDLEHDLDQARKYVAELEQQLLITSNAFESKLYMQNKRIIDLESQVKHWKSNHTNMQKKNAILRQRPDLPVDRIPACAFIDDAAVKITELEQRLTDLQTDKESSISVIKGLESDLKCAQEKIAELEQEYKLAREFLYIIYKALKIDDAASKNLVLQDQVTTLQNALESVLDSWRCGESIAEAGSVYADARALVGNAVVTPDEENG